MCILIKLFYDSFFRNSSVWGWRASLVVKSWNSFHFPWLWGNTHPYALDFLIWSHRLYSSFQKVSLWNQKTGGHKTVPWSPQGRCVKPLVTPLLKQQASLCQCGVPLCPQPWLLYKENIIQRLILFLEIIFNSN